MSDSNSIFVISVLSLDRKNKLPVRLKKETIGYFDSLSRVEYFLSFPNSDYYWFLEEKLFKIFEVDEFGKNYFLTHLEVAGKFSRL